MKKEKIQEIAEKIIDGLDMGINFISWQDIVSYVREEDLDSATIALYTDYLYHGEYERAKQDGLTMIKFFGGVK